MNQLDRILEIDQDNLTALVEPGVITADLANAMSDLGLFYPPDPGSMAISTIGGNITVNAGGLRGLKYGVTRDFVMGLEIVLPTGQVLHTGSKYKKDVAGYQLSSLFIGSEGTLGIITLPIYWVQECTIVAADIDSDDDMDILGTGFVDNIFNWGENDMTQNFTMHDIAIDHDKGEYQTLIADMDGDDDLDLLASLDNICELIFF